LISNDAWGGYEVSVLARYVSGPRLTRLSPSLSTPHLNSVSILTRLMIPSLTTQQSHAEDVCRVYTVKSTRRHQTGVKSEYNASAILNSSAFSDEADESQSCSLIPGVALGGSTCTNGRCHFSCRKGFSFDGGGCARDRRVMRVRTK